jgi:uncharacterized protein (TIGR03032 family)
MIGLDAPAGYPAPQNVAPASQPMSSADAQIVVEANFSRGFGEWLIRHQVGLVASTYQTGHVMFAGVQQDAKPVLTAARFSRAMGLSASSQRVYVGASHGVWRLENMLVSGELANNTFDRLYVPRNAQVTGEIDIHELVVEPQGRIVFANTAYSCLATVSATHSFKPIWKPPFISRLAPEDRCHLNGIAMESGRPRYVTACSTSDVLDGWRDHRKEGGVLMDIETDAVVADGLSMPHSPRVRENFIYLVESGRGALIRIDRQTGKREDVAYLNGFARGLAFAGDFAVLTISLPRWGNSFEALKIAEMMKARGAAPWRGVQIVNLRNGDILDWMRLEGDITELFDVALVPGVRCPRGLGPEAAEMRELVRWEP